MATLRTTDRQNKPVMFDNCAPFTNCTSKINNTQLDNAKDLDLVMLVYKLIKYSNSYSYSCRDGPLLNKAAITESEPFKSKSRLLNNTIAAGTVNVEITVPLKYFSNFWWALEINLTLTWSANCIISEVDRVTIFAITDLKLYVPTVTWSTQGNAKLLQELKLGFKRTINLDRSQWKARSETQKQYLDYLIEPSFQGVNKLFVYGLKIMTIE